MRKSLLISTLFFIQATLAQQIQIISRNELIDLLKPDENQLQVFNFWASWCAPCVKELPIFKQATEKYGNQLQVTLISLDFAEDISKAQNILQKKGINFKTYLLSDTKYNEWIDKVEPQWQGAIPMTILQKGKKRIFINEEVSWQKLEKYIIDLLGYKKK